MDPILYNKDTLSTFSTHPLYIIHSTTIRGDQLYAVNRVSGKVVAEVGFRSPLTKSVSGEPSRSFGEPGIGNVLTFCGVRFIKLELLGFAIHRGHYDVSRP